MTLMGEGAGDIEVAGTAGRNDDRNDDHNDDNDLDWARDLFDGARGEAEPGWGTDVAALTRAGDRRRRRRMAGTGGGVLGVVAVTLAVAVTLGAGTTDHGAVSGPAGGWGGKKLQEVFRYAALAGGGGGSGNVDFYTHVPESAAADVAALVGRLDPAGAHLRGAALGPGDREPRIVGDDDQALTDIMSLDLSSTWTADGNRPGAILSVPSARLAYGFFKDVNSLHRSMAVGPDRTPVAQPCGLAVDYELLYTRPDRPAPAPAWSECRYTVLSDGSKVGTTRAAFGAGTETVAVRIFGAGNVVALIGWDYRAPGDADRGSPIDARYVVSPSPWSQEAFRAALSDPAVGPVFPPMPAPNADGKLLMPGDLGPDWGFDLGQGPVTTGEYVMDDGCSPDHSVFGLAPGRGLNYTGKLPDGTPATLFEGEYRLPAGTGAATMRDARKYAVGGCDPQPDYTFSEDTLTDLPSGIGDDAFIQNQPGLATARVNVRVGDTILETIVVRSDHQRLDLTSADGRAWLAGIARAMAAHWTASAPGAAPGKAR